MMKCKVCGKRFNPDKNNVYKVHETLGITEALTKHPKTFDATDCPRCGCQHLLSIRLPQTLEKVVDDDD